MVINDAKFRVCASNSFGNIKLRKEIKHGMLVGSPIILKFKIHSLWEIMLLIYPQRVMNRVSAVNIFLNN